MLDPSLILHAQGLTPDPWQAELLRSAASYLLLNCARQTGKSTTVAALALHRMLTVAGSLVLLVAPSERQSHELFRKVLHAYFALGQPIASVKSNQSELELANGSRLVALPGREETIRSFSGVHLLILDEASRVPDDLYRSVRPMLAVSQGRLFALSTPFGQRGWFYDEWIGSGPWQRVHIPWSKCPRIRADFIAEEVRALGQGWVDQEYNGMFTAMEGLVFPDFEACVAKPRDERGDSRGSSQQVGGIDFGWRNPFAAIWGVLDHDDVLWITHERYLRETPLSDHAAALPREVMWYADPAGATEIGELRRAGLLVRRGDNNIRRGIALVTGRIRSGRLKVAPSCVNLIGEARLYRYPTPAEREQVGENPIDAHNHALAALRYLVSRIVAPR
ncbi:MAG TPA: phage terminase large subunit [Gemmataceae bacterium]|nr:phage terminase large subunit [Gemmataceae bacterium]